MLCHKVLGGAVSPLKVLLTLSILLALLLLGLFSRLAHENGVTMLKPLPIQRPTYNATLCDSDEGRAMIDDPSLLLFHFLRPLIHDMTEKNYKNLDGKEFNLPDGPYHWTQPQGKKVLILDVDSRFENQEHTLLNQSTLHVKDIQKRSAGRLSHMIYAMAHGYDYRFVRAPEFRDRYGTWSKVPILREAIKTHDTVVFLDADAYFVNLDLPIEWLMNYWGITPNTSIAVAKDPDTRTNRDSKGEVLWNTGFIIAQNSPRTQEILQSLEDCPTEKKYKGCKKWKMEWAHEQRAFGEYIRYDYNQTTDILPLKFGEANSPNGQFIRHDWPKRKDPLGDLQRGLMELVVRRSHLHFHEQLGTYYRDFATLEHPLNDIGV